MKIFTAIFFFCHSVLYVNCANYFFMLYLYRPIKYFLFVTFDLRSVHTSTCNIYTELVESHFSLVFFSLPRLDCVLNLCRNEGIGYSNAV